MTVLGKTARSLKAKRRLGVCRFSDLRLDSVGDERYVRVFHNLLTRNKKIT